MDDIGDKLRAIQAAAGIGTVSSITNVRYQEGTANQIGGHFFTWANGTVTIVTKDADVERLLSCYRHKEECRIEGYIYEVPPALKGEAQP